MDPFFVLFFWVCGGMIGMVYVQDYLDNYEHVVHPE